MPAFWPILVQSLLAATPSATDPPAWTLEWSASADCPSAAEVDGIVARWRAQAPPTSAVSNVRARGRIEARPSGGFALQLEIDADGVVTSHAVEADDCRALADATALQIAMALGFMPDTPPESSETTTDTPPSGIPTPPPRSPDSMPTKAPATAAPVRRERRPLALRGALRLQGGAGTGRVPRVDGRLGIAAGLLWPRARIEVVVAHTFMQPKDHPDRDGLLLRVWQWTALARGCWTPHVGPIELPLCGGLEAGASRATSRGAERHRTATSPLVAAVLTGALAWPFARRFALWVEVDGWVGLTQPAFTVEDLPPWFVTRRGGVDGAMPASASCDGICTGPCDGNCGCVDDEGVCMGVCDGMCMGACEIAETSCSGDGMGICSGAGGPACDGDWMCTSEGFACSLDCSSYATPIEVPRKCELVAVVAGAASMTCEPPFVSLQYAAASCPDFSTTASVLEEAAARLERDRAYALRSSESADSIVSYLVMFEPGPEPLPVCVARLVVDYAQRLTEGLASLSDNHAAINALMLAIAPP